MLWLIQPLGPALILLTGALALALLRPILWRRWASIGALLIVLSAWTTLIALRSPQAAILAGRPWTSILLDIAGGLTWQVNAWNWTGGWIIGLLAVVVVLLTWNEGERLGPYLRALDLAVIAAALLITFAANLLTLASMWVLMESMALARLILEPTHQPETGRSGLSAASALLMALASVLSGPALLTTPLTSAQFTPLTQGVLITAIMLRAAVYPLHGWLTHSRLSSPGDRLSIYLIPATTGLWLLGQLNSMQGIAWVGGLHWTVLMVVSLFGSSLAAWAETDLNRSLDLISANRATLILLTMSLWPEHGAFPLAGWLLAFSLGLALLLVARRINREWGARWPGYLAILTLLAYPITAGFLGQTWTARLAPPTGLFTFWILLALADSLLLTTLLREWQPRGPYMTTRANKQMICLLITTILLAVPLVFVGLRPNAFLRLSGIADTPPGLLTLIRKTPPTVWARLLVVAALALWLSYSGEPAFVGWPRLRALAARIAQLEWVYGLTQTAALAFQRFWQAVLRIVEGDGYVGWIMLSLLVLWLLSRT